MSHVYESQNESYFILIHYTEILLLFQYLVFDDLIAFGASTVNIWIGIRLDYRKLKSGTVYKI